MRILKILVLSSVLVCFAPLAVANDSSAVIGAGGLVLTQSDAIAMAEENLFISESKIRVAYKFRNTSAKPITTRVAFPLPELPYASDMDMNVDVSSANPMQFVLTVDGKEKAFETERKTRKEGTERYIKITHHWMQTFPAHSTVSVVHTYVPIVGGGVDFGMHNERDGRFCIEPALQAWIDTNYAHDKHMSTAIVHYILTTGANWKGAIGKFKLTVKKTDANHKLSFCGTGLKKVNSTTFVMEKTNFTPTRDLQILYLKPYALN